MRRIVGSVLIGLGVFAVALALLLPFYVVPRAKKTPLDLNITIMATGTGKILNGTGTLQDEKVESRRIVRTDSQASDSKYTTVDESLCTYIIRGDTPVCPKDDRLLSFTTDRVTADRKTAESVHIDAYHENVNGDTSVRHTGLSYKWPIDAKKQTYQFFQPDLKQAFPATYQGTSKLKGLTVYEYVCSTGPQAYQIGGAVSGTYADTRTVFVEPTTGTIVKGIEHQVQMLTNGQVAVDITLTFDDKSQTSQANYAKSKIDRLRLVELWLPIILGVVGLALLVGGGLLFRKAPSGGRRGGGRGAIPQSGPPAGRQGTAQGPPTAETLDQQLDRVLGPQGEPNQRSSTQT